MNFNVLTFTPEDPDNTEALLEVQALDCPEACVDNILNTACLYMKWLDTEIALMHVFTISGNFKDISRTTDRLGLKLRVLWVLVGGDRRGGLLSCIGGLLGSRECRDGPGGVVCWFLKSSPRNSLWSLSLSPTFVTMSFSQSGPGLVDNPMAIALPSISSSRVSNIQLHVII